MLENSTTKLSFRMLLKILAASCLAAPWIQLSSNAGAGLGPAQTQALESCPRRMRASVLVSATTECKDCIPNVLFSLCLEVEATLGVANAFDSRLVHEPTASVTRSLVNDRAGKAGGSALFKNTFHDVLLAATSSDKGDPHRVGDHGQGQGDALGRRLRAVLDRCNPGSTFAQKFVTWEKGAGVAIGATTEKQEVENRQADGVAAGEGADQNLLVVIGNLQGLLVEFILVDWVHFGLSSVCRDLVEQFLLQQAEVGVFVVQGDDPLVGKENLPLVPLDGVVGARRRREQCLGQGLGQRTAGHGYLEGVMTGDAGILALNHVCAQSRSEGGDIGEGKEIGLAVDTHRCGGLSEREGTKGSVCLLSES